MLSILEHSAAARTASRDKVLLPLRHVRTRLLSLLSLVQTCSLQSLRNTPNPTHPRLLGRHLIAPLPRHRQLLLVAEPVLRRLHSPRPRLLPHPGRHIELLRAA